MPKFIEIMRRVDMEAYVWMLGLAIVILLGPSESGFAACLFKSLGFDFCPGCGLGRSIAHLARGEMAASFHAHPLGLPAVAVLGHRIVTLVRNSLQQYHKEISHAEHAAIAARDRKRGTDAH